MNIFKIMNKSSLPQILTICLYLFSIPIAAQDCLEYPEIDGSECVVCTPEGWTEIGITSPDIIPGDGSWPGGGCIVDGLAGESPGGGNMILFVAVGSSNYEEGMETSVNGLIEGQQYGFGLYWQNVELINCGNYTGGDLLIELDGEEYEFSGADEWEFIEICFVVSSSSVDIALSIISDGGFNALVVDSPQCEQVTPCCPLVLSLEEEEAVICPGAAYTIEAEVENAEGSVSVEWTSDPSDGIDFLSDPNILEPSFIVNNIEDFEGETYLFTLVFEDDNCILEREFELEVLRSEVPDFDISICELLDEGALPTESQDGYTGTWVGDFEFDEYAGGFESYTLILDPGQDNCIEEWEYEIFIEEALKPTFEIADTYCILDEEEYDLPDESLEDIEGEWDVSRIDPSFLGVGVFEFTFTPDLAESCGFPISLEVEIFNADSLSFNLPSQFCASADTFFMPEFSNEQVPGVWEEPFIILDTQGDFEIEFEPEDVNDCYFNYVYSYSVNLSGSASFAFDTSLCRSAQTFTPDSFSVENYLGIWTPNMVEFDTITGDVFEMSWSPVDNLNGCLQDTTISFSLTTPVEPQFDIIDTICALQDSFFLPQQSLNNITGRWNIDSVIPSEFAGQLIQINFIPDNGDCISDYSDSIFIVPSDEAFFSFPLSFCAEDDAFDLPLISDNGIEGNWSQSTLDPSLIQDSLRLQFTPDPESCLDVTDVLVIIDELIEPLFSLPDFLCENQSYSFPEISDNGITGSWQINTFDASAMNQQDIFVNTFVPDDLFCFSQIDIEIPVILFPEFEFQLSDPTECDDNNGTIDISFSSAREFEFSIDQGNSWVSQAIFNGLSAGDYTISVRPVSFPDCIEQFDFLLTDPEFVQITQIEAASPDDCNNNNGTIEVFVNQTNLEYSIEQGASWQNSPVFQDLIPGDYEITIRIPGTTSCTDTESIRIDSFIVTNLLAVQSETISDCGADDGSIEIVAIGSSLEYSIDNGQSWQAEALFDGLESGEYSIVVRSAVDNNCVDEQLVMVQALPLPDIQQVLTVDISDCNANDGMISLSANDIESYEFSIDQGQSWQSETSFHDLSPGDYTILIRNINFNACQSTVEASLFGPEPPNILIESTSNPTDCISADGRIELSTNSNNSEYSIDNGISWQQDNVFEGLSPGNYEILLRPVAQPGCISGTTVQIDSVDCPCNDLDYAFNFNIPDCLNPLSGAIELIDINGFFTNEDFDIIWSNGGNGTSINNISAGNYSFIINYDKNCSIADSVVLEEIEPLSYDLISFDQDCKNLGTIEVTDLTGGSGDYLFSLDNFEFQESSVFFNLSADDYEVLINDAFGCDTTDTAVINDNSNLIVELPELEPINRGESILLNPFINESTVDNFEWSPSTGILNPGELIVQVAPETTTEYTLTVFFGDCVETRSVTVEVIENNDIYIPGVISQNEPGINSFFFPQSFSDSKQVIDFLAIFDRWGNKVYENKNFQINQQNEA
jgi:hypothetical protein